MSLLFFGTARMTSLGDFGIGIFSILEEVGDGERPLGFVSRRILSSSCLTFEIGVSSSAKTKTVTRPCLKRRVREVCGMSPWSLA